MDNNCYSDRYNRVASARYNGIDNERYIKCCNRTITRAMKMKMNIASKLEELREE
jgi:hypothetical protein